MAGPSSNIVSEEIERLEARSYKTYLSRLKAYRRLAHANIGWNIALVALSTSTAIASVGMLADRNMYGAGGDVLMVALAIFSLSISLVVSGVGYGIRAKAMEESYKRIQQISISAENLKGYLGADKDEKYEKLRWEYDVAVASSENHTDRDYWVTKPGSDLSKLTRRGRMRRSASVAGHVALAAIPYFSLVIPVLLLIPFGVWFADGF